MTPNPGPYAYPLAAALIRLGIVRTAGQQRRERMPDDDREWSPGRCWRSALMALVPLWAIIIALIWAGVQWWWL